MWLTLNKRCGIRTLMSSNSSDEHDGNDDGGRIADSVASCGRQSRGCRQVSSVRLAADQFGSLALVLALPKWLPGPKLARARFRRHLPPAARLAALAQRPLCARARPPARRLN